MSVSTRWCFTLNNYTEEEVEAINGLDVKYMIYGKEISPTTGTPHLQGFIVFSGSKKITGVSKLIPRAYLVVAKGSSVQNITYCSKEKDVVEFGIRPKTPMEKGDMERERWIRIIAHAKSGTLEEHDPKVFYQTVRTSRMLEAEFAKPIAITKNVKVFWGKTGTGKSHTAWAEAGEDAYQKDPRSKFWYGYNGQENVIMDEFRGGIDISHILRWVDKWPVTVEIKNSSRVLKVKNLWIMSNLHPKDWYPDLDRDTVDALLRRFKISEFHGDLLPVTHFADEPLVWPATW